MFELKGVDFHALGVQLDLPSRPTLKNIERDYQGNERRLSEVLEYWLNNNRGCSWEKIVHALERISGHGKIIATIKSTYIKQHDIKPGINI